MRKNKIVNMCNDTKETTDWKVENNRRKEHTKDPDQIKSHVQNVDYYIIFNRWYTHSLLWFKLAKHNTKHSMNLNDDIVLIEMRY